MIKVIIETDDKGNIISYEMSGHADFAPHGEDIVCAGASILGYTALRSLLEVVKVDESSLSYKVDNDKGYLKVSLGSETKGNKESQVQIVLGTYEIGIKSMIESYPKYITLEYRGGGTGV